MGKGDAREGVRRGRMRKMPIAGLSQFGLHRYCPFSLHAFFLSYVFYITAQDRKWKRGRFYHGKVMDGAFCVQGEHFSILPFIRYIFYTYTWSIKQNK